MKPSGYRYAAYPAIDLPDRQWPGRVITKSPIWCSTDLRDGNQALSEPMSVQEKLEFFTKLVETGFKEIEVAYPSANDTEFKTVRTMIEGEVIPDDVTIQVLTPARDDLIERTFLSVEGAKNVLVHLYMNTSPFFRDVVYRTDKKTMIRRLEHAAALMRSCAGKKEGIRFMFAPESFTDTEPEFALEVCTAMLDAFGADREHKLILNLPATVERSMPNQFADRIEYMIRHLPDRERYLLGVHPHNDRGTGVAAAELALLAGADRVEGTLFGNGERTGNVDIITVAMNLFTHGIDPGLDFSHMNDLRHVFERTTRMHVYDREPYSGELVFTAFSGTHQDAIKKGFDNLANKKDDIWDMPYLPVNPRDVGREYEPIIRINSQSGKGGAAFLLREYAGYDMPRRMQPEFGKLVKELADRTGAELPPERLLSLFLSEYCDINAPYRLIRHSILEQGAHDGHSSVVFEGLIETGGDIRSLRGEGNGPIDAFFSAMKQVHLNDFEFASYHEHAIGSGSDARACAYIELLHHGESFFGVGIDGNVSVASIKGVLSAINRAFRSDMNLKVI